MREIGTTDKYDPDPEGDKHIYCRNGRWGFWDETAGPSGTWETRDLAVEAMALYGKWLNATATEAELDRISTLYRMTD